MAKGSVLSNGLLALLFNATAFSPGGTAFAINATSSPGTQIYASLHTADPTSAGNQSSSETTYGAYARVAVVRTSSGWTISTNTVVPVAAITFPAGTSGSGTVTNFALGVASSGTGAILYTGTVSPSIVVGNGITPILTTASTITET